MILPSFNSFTWHSHEMFPDAFGFIPHVYLPIKASERRRPVHKTWQVIGWTFWRSHSKQTSQIIYHRFKQSVNARAFNHSESRIGIKVPRQAAMHCCVWQWARSQQLLSTLYERGADWFWNPSTNCFKSDVVKVDVRDFRKLLKLTPNLD